MLTPPDPQVAGHQQEPILRWRDTTTHVLERQGPFQDFDPGELPSGLPALPGCDPQTPAPTWVPASLAGPTTLSSGLA